MNGKSKKGSKSETEIRDLVPIPESSVELTESNHEKLALTRPTPQSLAEIQCTTGSVLILK